MRQSNLQIRAIQFFNAQTQPAISYSKSTIETIEQGERYVQS